MLVHPFAGPHVHFSLSLSAPTHPKICFLTGLSTGASQLPLSGVFVALSLSLFPQLPLILQTYLLIGPSIVIPYAPLRVHFLKCDIVPDILIIFIRQPFFCSARFVQSVKRLEFLFSLELMILHYVFCLS